MERAAVLLSAVVVSPLVHLYRNGAKAIAQTSSQVNTVRWLFQYPSGTAVFRFPVRLVEIADDYATALQKHAQTYCWQYIRQRVRYLCLMFEKTRSPSVNS